MKIKNPVMLKDALHNLDTRSGANNDYCQGMVVGIVSALMAMGFPFKDALAQVAANIPAAKYMPRYAVPDSWREEFVALIPDTK